MLRAANHLLLKIAFQLFHEYFAIFLLSVCLEAVERFSSAPIQFEELFIYLIILLKPADVNNDI